LVRVLAGDPFLSTLVAKDAVLMPAFFACFLNAPLFLLVAFAIHCFAIT